jgi:hypothetical protein
MKKLNVVLLALCGVACAGQPKMQVGMPIENHGDVVLRRDFRQDGVTIDSADMIRTLGEDARSSQHIAAYKGWRTASLLLAAAGGALIGWPVGEALGGKREPMWELAAIGGGLATVSFPLGVVSEFQLHQAVKTYNAGLENEAVSFVPRAPRAFGTASALHVHSPLVPPSGLEWLSESAPRPAGEW